VIRKKAVVKYQNELKSRMQKILEYDVLIQQMNKIKNEHQELTKTVANNKKYKDFLTDAIDMLPDSKIKLFSRNNSWILFIEYNYLKNKLIMINFRLSRGW
jgi:hypothetical protein